jgi:NNP family nitrate/nitrite transporter-like MFS transporter
MKTSISPESRTSKYKWYVLTLAALTHTIVVGIPLMSIPVLFDEMANELGLTLVQMGWVWGIGFLTGIITSLIGGALGDRFGAKWTLSVCCFLSGITGALRALASDFGTLAATAFLFGLVPPAIPMNVHKICGVWFSGRYLALANGIVSAGMALGFLLGSLLSATVLSPWLGGWRPVLFLYGALSIVVAVFWYFTIAGPPSEKSGWKEEKVSLRYGLPFVARIRSVWLLGLTMFGIGGCVNGTLGYLPFYLRRIHWPETFADTAVAVFNAVSMVAAIPMVMLSNRLGSRKGVLIVGGVMTSAGVALLFLPGGFFVWAAVIIAGFVRDGFMAVLMTLLLEIKKVGTKYAGTAMGMVLVFSRLGSLISPPLGNSLADFDLALPFLFWAALALMGLFCLCFVKEIDS